MADERVTKSAAETDGDVKTWRRRGLFAAAWAAVAAIVVKQTTAPVEASTGMLIANTETAGISNSVVGPSTIAAAGGFTSPSAVLIADAHLAAATSALAAIHGSANTPSDAPELCGVFGQAIGFTGVLGQSSTANGVKGLSNSGSGVRGEIPGTSALNGIAVYGANLSSYAGGGPGAGGFGCYGLSAKGHGLVGATAASGAGAMVGATNGVAGAYAGLFYGPVIVTGSFTVVGAKSAAVPHPDGSQRLVYCMESPESWFEDFGKGQLDCGRADVTIDPNFAAVADMEDYHVFVTEYGQNNAVCVTEQTPTGFRVQASNTGVGEGRFSWRVVAKRKDIVGERLAKVTIPPEPQLPTEPPMHEGSRMVRQ